MYFVKAIWKNNSENKFQNRVSLASAYRSPPSLPLDWAVYIYRVGSCENDSGWEACLNGNLPSRFIKATKF